MFYIGTKKKKGKKVNNATFEESKYDQSFYDSRNFDKDRSWIVKTEESDEEFITEELFQKALQAALNQNGKKKNNGKKKGGNGRERSMILQKYIDSPALAKIDNDKNITIQNDDLVKFKPLCPALPKNLPQLPNIAERIRAAKRVHMTRRDMTEQKIIKNILSHNDPSEMQNFEVLYISNKKDPFLPDSFQKKGKEKFPPID